MLGKTDEPRKEKNNAGETVEEFEIPNYEFIVQTIQTGKCVLLLGPDACLATDKIGRTTTFTRLTAAALLRSRRVRQYYKEEDLFQFRSETEENEARYDLKKVFLKPYPTAYYEEIAQIPFHLVIYSSPAPCLRKTFEQHRLPHTHDYFNRFGTPPVMSAPSAECPLLYQITGSMQDPDSLILTYDDMFEYVAAILGQQKLPNSVKTALLDDNVKHLILLGFRLDRWYVHLLLQLLQYKKVKSRLRTYAYSQSLPPHIRVFCREQFNVSFVSTPPEEFIHRLFLHAQAYAQTPEALEEGFALRPLSVQPQTVKPEIFISYAWGKESDTIADKLYHNLKEKGYNPILDRMELNYTGKISEFMQRIGASHYIIPVISKNYLQSRNCMYEVLQMEKHAKLHDRIFPIVLEDAQLYEDGKRGEYVNYWYEEMQKLDAEIKRFPTMAYKNSFVEELSLYSDIHRMIGDFMNLIKNMNNLTTQIHEESGFRQLMLEIDKRIATELHHGNP